MPNPTLPVTEVSALQAPAGLSYIELRSTIQFLNSADKTSFLEYLGELTAVQYGTVFVSPTGDDGDAGDRSAPFANPGTAASALEGAGQIVLLAGDYDAKKLNLATVRDITIGAEAGAKVRVFFGTKLDTFVSHSGSVWKVAADEPAAGLAYVWEKDTEQYSIVDAARDPVFVERTHRQDHYALTKASSVANVDAGNGRWFWESGFLYIRASDGLDPNGREFYIPSDDPDDCFIYGALANAPCRIRVQGIEVCFAYRCFNSSNAQFCELIDCTAVGALEEGWYANRTQAVGRALHIYGASNDGVVIQETDFAYPASRMELVECAIYHCHDKGAVAHENALLETRGGWYAFSTGPQIMCFNGASGALYHPRVQVVAQGGISLYSDGHDATLTIVMPDIRGETASGDYGVACEHDGGIVRIIGGAMRGLTRGAVTGSVGAIIDIFGTYITASDRTDDYLGARGTITEYGVASSNLVLNNRSGVASTVNFPNVGGTNVAVWTSGVSALTLTYLGSASYRLTCPFGLEFAGNPGGYICFLNNSEYLMYFDLSTGDMLLSKVGSGLRLKEGTNAKSGVATLSSGTVTVSTTKATATMRVLLSRQGKNSATGIGALAVGTINAGTSFVIDALKSDGTVETGDTSIVYWTIIEPS